MSRGLGDVYKRQELPRPIYRDIERIRPTKEECDINPRSRSAILRVGVRTDTPWQGGH